MIRNLVLKLPSLTCSTDLRQRTFRSLSPIDKFRLNTVRTSSETSITSRHLNRTVTYTREHFNKHNQIDEDAEEPPKEIRWREQPQKRKSKIKKEKQKKEAKVKESEYINEEQRPVQQIQYYEQYELEAARPRSIKSQEIINKLKAKPTQSMFGTQLQPNELQPFGSRDNVFSYNLIASTGSRSMRKKFIKKENMEDEADQVRTGPSRRSYSTSVKPKVLEEEQITEITEPRKIEQSHESLKNTKTNFKINLVQGKSKLPWGSIKSQFDISPPKFKETDNEDIKFVKFSSQQVYRQRREQANKDAAIYYKQSYSDLIKLKQREATKAESLNKNFSELRDQHIDFINNTQKSDTILDEKPKTPFSTRSLEKRSMSTLTGDNALNSYKSNFLTRSQTPLMTSRNLLNATNPVQEQKTKYSKAKSKTPTKKYDPCREQKKKQTSMRFTVPMEPKDLDCVDPPKSNKVFLSSKVRLPVVKCLPKFDYDCSVPEPCPPRADKCLKVLPKRLPVMIAKECPCIEEVLKDAPKLRRLCFEFKDPPREKCFQEPCTTPRADEENPYKFKPLKPLEMGECVCIEPPQMTGVKLKRLPPCQPKEVCRPVREPCIPEPCPPRADVCLKVVRKRLPLMQPPVCPCKEPPAMTAPPPLARLCLSIPEPKRVCPPPPVCECKERSDKCFKPQKKVLPKFVPGDCPCEDRPMTDVKFKRLECIDEPRECIVKVPDHCTPYPRADYGCWEFEDETCYEVPEHCVEKKPDPCNPPKCKDPCERRDICKTSGPLSYNSKRKYNTDSTSMKLFNRLKSKNNIGSKCIETKNMTIEAAANKRVVANTKRNKRIEEKLDGVLKRNISLPTIRLLKELDKMTTKDNRKNITFDARYCKRSSNKVDYNNIIRKIESTSALVNQKKTCKSATLLSAPLCISSRAISTSQAAGNHEKKIRDAKNLESKKKCQSLKPKTLCHPKGIKGGIACGQTKCKDANACKKERVPVCCEKEEAPYAAFSDKIYDMKVNPYKDFNHCYKCLKTRWPDISDNKPVCEKRKYFSTSSLLNELSAELRLPNHLAATSQRSFRHPLNCNLGISPKATLSNPTFYTMQPRSYATKVFKIKKPVTKCDDFESMPQSYKITCINYDYEPCQTTEKSCTKIVCENTEKKIKTPYPAFSDCLDEDMEDILSECPLEIDRYTQLQPRHIPPANRIRTPLPPPPKSEPLDLLKEQHCIKARLGKYEGTTQHCQTIGDKMTLLKSRDVFKEPSKDCERIKQLKKEGRTPLTLIQNRRPYFTVTNFFHLRQFSTFLGGLNSIHEITNGLTNINRNEVKRIYIRNFHSLIKDPEKCIFREIDNKMKEFTKMQFPDISNSCKLLKLKNDQWRKEKFKKFNRLNKYVNIPIRLKRFYTSYKIKHKYSLKKSARNVCSKAASLQRRSSDARFKFLKPQDDKEQCKKSNRKFDKDTKCSKFTLNNCPASNFKCTKKTFFDNDCEKPNTPYPSFSECGDHDLTRPFCECSVDAHQLDDLQPKNSVLPVLKKKKFPTEEKIDTTLGREYCRQKMSLQKGLTLNCESFPEYVSAKKANKIKPKISDSPLKKTKLKMECEPTKPPKNKCKEDDIYNVEIECVIADKKEICDPCRDLQACCSQILEKHLCENQQTSKPVIPPCCLPEEDQACREYCRQIVLSDNISPHEESYKEFCKKIIRYENSDTYNGKPNKLYEDEAICKNTSKDVKEFCKQVTGVKSKEVPGKINGLSQECTQKLLQDCEKIANLAEKCLKHYSENECDKVKPKHIPKSKAQCKPKCEDPPKPKCPKFKVPCEGAVSKKTCHTEPTLILSLWQRIVNYFKARPGCPEPGEWKKKALNDKAHKAAAAAGLVAVDPKYLPPDVLTKTRSDPCCRACPSEPICKPPESKHEDDVCAKPKGTKSSAAPEKKGKFGMFRRNYSKRFSWTNLEEINKILEENRQEKNIQRASKYLNKEFAFFSKNEEHTKQVQKSLQYQLKAFPLRISTVSRNIQNYPRTYFGYTNILPSRENVLERAWRLSMEAAKKSQSETQAVGFLNEIFQKVDNSVKSQEDLEKTKTENVLRELDQFLKLKEDSNKDNK